MKIIVDKLPESPAACPFSQHNCEYGYLCTLRPVIEYNGKRPINPIIRCKSVERCECLIELEDVK